MIQPSRSDSAIAVAEQQDRLLRRDLSLRDLVFAQVLFIVGLQWVGVAAREGPSHVILWLIAVALFYIPSAVVAVWLSRQMPLEGGLYQWAKLGFNETLGFIVAWNLWVFAILNMTNIGLQFTQYLGYMFGPATAQFMDRNWVISSMSAVIIGVLALLTILGLKFGRWVHTAGGILLFTIFAMIIALLWNSAGIFYGLTYLAMFAVPLIGLKNARSTIPLAVRICALSGLMMTLLYVGLSVLPIIDVGSRFVFALKIAGLIVVANLVGLTLYLAGRRRAAAAAGGLRSVEP